MRDDSSPVSIFRISSSSKTDPKLVAARNGVRRLKMVLILIYVHMADLASPAVITSWCMLQLRHPNILAFKDTAEVEEKGETVIYLVTEPVKPLADCLDELDMTGSARC